VFVADQSGFTKLASETDSVSFLPGLAGHSFVNGPGNFDGSWEVAFAMDAAPAYGPTLGVLAIYQ
jgi:hypothetical protein